MNRAAKNTTINYTCPKCGNSLSVSWRKLDSDAFEAWPEKRGSVMSIWLPRCKNKLCNDDQLYIEAVVGSYTEG